MTTSSTPDLALPRLCAAGHLAICLATGPSLAAADVDACRGRGLVIAINDAYRLAPWADVLYSSDRHWWMAHYRAISPCAGLKYAIEHRPGQRAKEFDVMPALRVLRNTGDQGIETDVPDGLRTGKNSGAAAINLAVQLGARRILLLGYDLGHRPGGPSHFFGDHPRRIHNDSPYVLFAKMFATMVAPLRDAGVEVLNCTRTTRLTAFPRVTLGRALGAREEAA